MRDEFRACMPNQYHPFTVKFIMTTADRYYVVTYASLEDWQRNLPGFVGRVRKTMLRKVDNLRAYVERFTGPHTLTAHDGTTARCNPELCKYCAEDVARNEWPTTKPEGR